MKRFTVFCFLAVLVALVPASRSAKAQTFVPLEQLYKGTAPVCAASLDSSGDPTANCVMYTADTRLAYAGSTGEPAEPTQTKPTTPAKKHSHSMKVGAGLKRTAHVAVKVATMPIVGPFADLEASVDALGVALQGVADALDLGVATPLEALPNPLKKVGLGVHVIYLGIDFVGAKLAE